MATVRRLLTLPVVIKSKSSASRVDAIMRVLSRVWVAAAVLLSVALWAGSAQAALQGRTVPSNGDPISIELDEGQLVRLDRGMASVFIANPEIADVKIGRAHV